MGEVLKLWHYVRRNQKVTKESTIFIFLGKALSGHVISVHQASSEIACTQKCLSNPKCASFNFEIQQSRSLSTCELNAVSRTSPNNKLNSRSGFAYYEPLTLRERPKQQTTAFSLTTRNLIMAASTTQGTQEVSPTRDQATTPASKVPSTQPATTAAQDVSPTTAQGTQEVSPTQDQAATPASRVPSTQPATTAAPGKWFAKSKGAYSPRPRQLKALGRFVSNPFPQCFYFCGRSCLWLPQNTTLVTFAGVCYSQDLHFFRTIATKRVFA